MIAKKQARRPNRSAHRGCCTVFFAIIARMKAYLLVFVGGGVGSLLRYIAGQLVPATGVGSPFPMAILLVNMLASALLGIVVGWAVSRSVGEEVGLLVGVGFCGGLSTFSSFSYDTIALLQNGRPGTALLNIGLNIVMCLLASAGGLILGQKM